MEEPTSKKIDSPAWQNPAPGNEQNDSVKSPGNPTIKTGGNSRSAEDDLDLDKQPYRDKTFTKTSPTKAQASTELNSPIDNADDADSAAEQAGR